MAWLDTLATREASKVAGGSRELGPEAECWFLLSEAVQATHSDTAGEPEIVACSKARHVAALLKDGHIYTIAAPMLQGHLLHKAGLFEKAASSFLEGVLQRDLHRSACE
jgi:hypothetical protein